VIDKVRAAGGSPEATRRLVNKAFLQDMALAWRKHGIKALEKCAKNQPAAFCKMYVLLVPREMKVEHSGGVASLTDEQLEQAIATLKEMIEGNTAKVIEATAEPVALPAPDGVSDDKPMRPNKVMDAADTGVGPRERKPRKRKVSPPAHA
jgi:hypothetical protein